MATVDVNSLRAQWGLPPLDKDDLRQYGREVKQQNAYRERVIKSHPLPLLLSEIKDVLGVDGAERFHLYYAPLRRLSAGVIVSCPSYAAAVGGAGEEGLCPHARPGPSRARAS